MKPFALFCGAFYYPAGGYRDFLCYTDTIEEALLALSNVEIAISGSWAHLINLRSGDIVRRWENHDDRVERRYQSPNYGKGWVLKEEEDEFTEDDDETS